MSIKPHPSLGPGWWYIIINHGRKGSKNYQPPEYIKFQGTEVEAQAFENELRGIEPGNNGRVKVIDMLGRFLEWHKTNRAPKTHSDCQHAFKRLLPYLGDKYIAYLKNRDYEPYKAARLETKIIPKRRNGRKDHKDEPCETDKEYEARCLAETRTVSKRSIQIDLNHFRAFLRWCEDEEKYTVGDYPKGFSKNQQKPKGKVVLALSEIPELIEQQKEGYLRTLTMLMLQNGLRKTEALTLRKRDVDLKNNSLIVHGKGNKVETIPIVTPELYEALEGACKDKKPTEYLFVNPRTNRPYTKISKGLKGAAARAGINKRVDHHLMRHSFVTGGLMLGVSTSTMKELARHEDIRTTQGYTHFLSDYLQSEAAKIASGMSGQKEARKPAKDKA